MIDVILDTLLDALKLLPFLFLTFLFIEYFEHKMSKKSEKAILNAGKLGPIIGGAVGALPQCGFSMSATNLFSTRIITMGTLIAVYLSTSDEMLPILISNKVSVWFIIKVLLSKVVIGIIAGLIIDLVMRKKNSKTEIKKICDECDCDCEHGIFKSSIKHTINIMIYIVIISFLLNTSLYYLGEDFISNMFLKDSIFGPFISSLVGLIPNCASSVAITELYLSNVISLGSMLSGLLTCSGVGLLVLFKTNKNLKENLLIVGIIYLAGALAGVLIDLVI